MVRALSAAAVFHEPVEVLPDVSGLRGGVGERDGPVEGDAGLLRAAELRQEGALHAEEVEIAGEPRLQRLDQGERRRRTLDLGESDRAVERDDGRGREPLQRRIEPLDLRPIGLLGRSGPGVEGGDRGLHLVRPRLPVAHGLVDEGKALGDHPRVPELAVLILQENDAAVPVVAGRSSRVLQEKERRQPHDLGLRREEPQQEPREADRLFAERRTCVGLAGSGGVALVEDEVDHRRDDAQPLGPLHGARHLERHVVLRDAALRPGDALFHGALADQEGAGDLLHVEAADDAQGEGDLLGRGQTRVAADEEEAQDVVAVLGRVEALGERRLPVVEVGEDLLRRQGLLLRPAPHRIDRDVAPDEDEPGERVPRRPLVGPRLQRFEAGLLERLLGRVEVAEIPQQRAHGLWPRGGQCGVDPSDVHFAAPFPMFEEPMGLSSKVPVDVLARASSCASSMASSRDEHSTTQKPRSCSLVGSQGPSITASSRPLRIVVAAVVGNNCATGPSRRSSVSRPNKVPRLAATASSSSLVLAHTSSSEA